jgi:hypothetical protein
VSSRLDLDRAIRELLIDRSEVVGDERVIRGCGEMLRDRVDTLVRELVVRRLGRRRGRY